RQHQVQHDHIVGVLHRQAVAVQPVGGIVDLEAAAFKVLAHHFRNVAVVLDDQDQPTCFLRCSHNGSSNGSSALCKVPVTLYKRREDVPLSPPRSTDALSPDPPASPPSTASTPSCSWSPPTCS